MSYQFQYQYFIYLFALLAVLLLMYVFYNRWRNKKLTIIGLPSLVRSMMPGYSAVRANGKFAMLSIAFIAGVLTVMHLRKPGDSGGISRKGIDVVFALDVSRSMLATDIAPSRLDRARQLMIKLIDKLPNDRIGLVVFAGQAYLQMALPHFI